MTLMLNAVYLPDNASFESIERYPIYRVAVILLERIKVTLLEQMSLERSK
jgi:hypothetical protein